MRTFLDCYPCILRQSLEAARIAGADQEQQRTVMLRAMALLNKALLGATPPEIATEVHQAVREIIGVDDPYLKVKDEARAKALSLLPRLKALIAGSQNPLETAIRLSIAGNIMDFGPNPDYDLWSVVQRVLQQDFAIDDLKSLTTALERVDSVLLIGDNVGESVFDRLLIETLQKPVTYVVRGGPVLNDTTREDALAVGIGEIAEVIDSGARIPGTILSECSETFIQRFNSAELILAKGMGNYETLSEVPAPIFFLLQIKCPVIGRDIGAPVGSIVLKRSSFV
jgi:uncharacterized protein with ATP-grasp and redox domains